MSTIREYTYSDVDADDSEPIVITENNRIRNRDEEIIEIEEEPSSGSNNGVLIVALFVGFIVLAAIAYLVVNKTKGKNRRGRRGHCDRRHHDHQDRGYTAQNQEKKSGICKNCQGNVCEPTDAEE